MHKIEKILFGILVVGLVWMLGMHLYRETAMRELENTIQHLEDTLEQREQAWVADRTETEYEKEFAALAGCYAFETLNDGERHWYVDIYRLLKDFATEGWLNPNYVAQLGTEGLDKVFYCVLNDHPEIFYVTGYRGVEHLQNDVVERIKFQGIYTMDAEEAQIRQEQIDLYVEECLAGISPEASDYLKVKYVYEYIIGHTDYRLDAAQGQNICSVFISRESVCNGYAKATQYLLEKLGVFCTLVTGKVGDVGHAWNLVRVDGEYYYVDTTWGDATYLGSFTGGQEAGYPRVSYDYLCVTTEEICKTHTINNVAEMPVCSATAANYYVKENAYFTTYDERKVGEVMALAQDKGQETVTIKCADSAVYQQLYDDFITRQYLFKYIEVPDGVLAYSDDSDKLLLTLWLK